MSVAILQTLSQQLNHMKAIFSIFCNCIKMIFPLLYTTFNAELDLWKQKWSTDNQKAAEVNTAEKALEFADVDFIPIFKLFHKSCPFYQSQVVNVNDPSVCLG